jgi:hypothetical protein
VSLGLSLGAGAVMATVDGGRLMLNSRDGIARWLEWLCPVVDLPRALPSFFWRGPWQAVGDAGIWAAVLLALWIGFRVAARAPTPTTLATAVPLLFGVGAMVSATIVWEVRGAAAVTPTSGQLRLMDAFDPAMRPYGVQYRPLRIRSSQELVGRLRVSTPERRPRAANAPPFWVRDLPAGTYRVLPAPSPDRPSGFGLSLPKSPLPFQHCSFEAVMSADCLVRLPTDVVELRVDAEGGARAAPPAGRTVALQPIDLLASRERPTRLKAIAAATYGAFSAFAFDQRVFLEPAGLWIEGGFEVPLVLASAEPRAALPVLLRNGARPNRVRIDGALTLDLPLAEREERVVMVPLDARSRAGLLRIRTDHGFRPSETEPGSRDQRYLGVWVGKSEVGSQ